MSLLWGVVVAVLFIVDLLVSVVVEVVSEPLLQATAPITTAQAKNRFVFFLKDVLMNLKIL